MMILKVWRHCLFYIPAAEMVCFICKEISGFCEVTNDFIPAHHIISPFGLNSLSQQENLLGRTRVSGSEGVQTTMNVDVQLTNQTSVDEGGGGAIKVLTWRVLRGCFYKFCPTLKTMVFYEDCFKTA